jgi:hypothetical protein
MKIKLIDFDSKIPNSALMDLSSWYKSKGDEVGFDVEDPDKVYVSVIFRKNLEEAFKLALDYKNGSVIFGGPGLGVPNHLPPALLLDNPKPDYDLYPSKYSQGYTTRGCIRNCAFCVVPKLEGKLRISRHPSEFHDDRFDTCYLMDNNLLAAPKEWVESVLNWFKDNGIKMISSQGWDARLLTQEYANMLHEIKHKDNGIHLAWDNMKDEEAVIRSIGYLKEAGFKLRNITYYVLCGFNTTFEQDMYRCNKLKELGVCAFVMPYREETIKSMRERMSKSFDADEIRDIWKQVLEMRKVNALARWCNKRELYWGGPFEKYTRRKDGKPFLEVIKEITL